MSKINKAPDFNKLSDKLIKDARRYAKVTGLNFFKDSFYNQGFTDESFAPWEGRKNDFDPGRKILIKSTSLLNALEAKVTGNKIVFKNDEPYARIHNEGGIIKHPGGTPYIIIRNGKAVFITNAKAKTLRKRGYKVKLTKPHLIKIPKRQFIGESATLLRQLDDWYLKQILNRFKTL